VNYAKTFFTSTFPEAWYYAFGALFVVVTLFLPRGIIGLIPNRARTPGASNSKAERGYMQRIRIHANQAQASRK
jgi:urea transport system permease protein